VAVTVGSAVAKEKKPKPDQLNGTIRLIQVVDVFLRRLLPSLHSEGHSSRANIPASQRCSIFATTPFPLTG
jgi:hypothetical protein